MIRVLALLAALAAPAFAATDAERRAACTPDALRLCKAEIAAGDIAAIPACLRRNQAKLSKACIDAVKP